MRIGLLIKMKKVKRQDVYQGYLSRLMIKKCIA